MGTSELQRVQNIRDVGATKGPEQSFVYAVTYFQKLESGVSHDRCIIISS